MPSNNQLTRPHPQALRRHLLRATGAAALVGVLAGCGVTSKPYTPQTGSWSGRISISVDDPSNPDKPQSYIAGFLIKGSYAKGTLEVYNPVGSTMAQLRWDANEAQLFDGKETFYAASLGELLTRVFGTELPTEALFAWLRGEPLQAQGWQVNLERYKEGRINATRVTPLPAARIRIALS